MLPRPFATVGLTLTLLFNPNMNLLDNTYFESSWPIGFNVHHTKISSQHSPRTNQLLYTQIYRIYPKFHIHTHRVDAIAGKLLCGIKGAQNEVNNALHPSQMDGTLMKCAKHAKLMGDVEHCEIGQLYLESGSIPPLTLPLNLFICPWK